MSRSRVIFRMVWGLLGLWLSVLGFSGCANSYVAPGGGADMMLFAGEEGGALGVDSEEVIRRGGDRQIEGLLARKPTARLPVHLAVVRVQASGYRSYTTHGYGRGNYSVVTIRDIETDADFERIEGLAEVAGVAWMNRLLLPEDLRSDRELRQAAAALHADMLLIYTIETEFKKEDSMTPLSVVTLGLSPTVKVYVTTTASVLLMDTRTGYVYGLAEGVGLHEQPAAWWTSEDAVDQSRRKTERSAFEDLLGEFEGLWPKVVEGIR